MAVAPRHSSLRLLIAIVLVLVALAAAQSDQPAYPTNTSAYPEHVNDTEQIVLNVQSPPIDLQFLSNKAYSAVDHSPNANASTVLGGGLAAVGPTTNGNLTLHAVDAPIAYISCDNSSYPPGMLDMNRTLTDAVAPGTNVSAIILFSTTSSFCHLGPLPQPVLDFGVIFTTTNSRDAFMLDQALKRQDSPPGYLSPTTITTLAAWQNMVNAARNQATGLSSNPEPGTAVAMIILYSITGVIALLFVIIIVTGAVRAHRHPERYGPRNVPGRVRQNRAVGIGRAMLETIPLVRFGESQPAPKPADVEMNSMQGQQARTTAEPEHSTPDGTREVSPSPAAADGSPPASTGASSAGAAATTTHADGAGKATAAETMNHQERVEKSLECAICWEDFEKGEEVRMLPCEHKFHPKCIDPWLLGFSGTCPVCRVDFGPKDKEAKPQQEGSSSSQ